MIAYDVSKLDNYIACDDDTQSEIVLPCFTTEEVAEEDDEEGDCFTGDAGGTGGSSKKKVVRKLKTLLDIDSTIIGNFDEEDQKGLEKLISLIYN
jgi:putative methionine-R-sulfoxide reductase with GAF domain